MSKLKKGWQGTVIIGVIASFIVSYVIIAYIYKFAANSKLELMDAMLQPLKIYDYVTNDENLKLIIPFIPIILISAALYLLRKNILDLKYDDASDFGVKGSAKWGVPGSECNGKTLSKQNKFSTNNHKKGLEMEEGIIIGKLPGEKKTLILHDKTDLDNKNVFVSGSSGSGKGQSHVITNLVNIRNEGIIVIDPKGENYEYTHQLKRDQGYKVYNIDFSDFSEAKYNPLDYVQNDEDAKKISEIITKNSADDVKMDYFTERAQELLSSLISYVKSVYPRKEANMGKVIEVFNKYVSDPDICNEWLVDMPDDNPAKGLIVAVLGDLTSPNTRSSVTSNFQSLISIFQLNRIKEMTKTSDFMFDDFQKEKSILYVKISVPTNPFKALTSVFFVQMIDRFFDLGDLDPLSKLKIPVNFILDEFPNIGKIIGYQETLALCRGYRMYMHTIIQDISQLEQRSMYGKETTRSIVSNHSTKLILKVGEPGTAEYWSKWFSDTTIKYRSESSSYGKQGKTVNHSDTYEKKKLLPENELMKMDNNEAYLLMTGHHPLKIEKSWQFLVYPNLLSNKNRELNYNNVRENLGFTDEVFKHKTEQKKVSIFEDYQSNRNAVKVKKQTDSAFSLLAEKANLTEDDIQEMNNKASIKKEASMPDDLNDIEKTVNEDIEKGESLKDSSVEDMLKELGY